MRRGLMGWDAEELPQGTLDERVARLQAAMRRDGFDAFLLYSNLVRPSAVCWLTGFTPYWIESLLLVGREGRAVARDGAVEARLRLDSRDQPAWARSSTRRSPARRSDSDSRPPAASASVSLEFDALPAGLYDDIIAAAPAGELIDATRFVRGRAPSSSTRRSAS